MLLPNMVPWCVDYFRLKEFENWQMKEGLSDRSNSTAIFYKNNYRIISNMICSGEVFELQR